MLVTAVVPVVMIPLKPSMSCCKVISKLVSQSIAGTNPYLVVSSTAASSRTKKRDTRHGVEVLSNRSQALGLLSNLVDGSDHLVSGDCTLFDGAGRGRGSEEGHDGCEDLGELHLGGGREV